MGEYNRWDGEKKNTHTHTYVHLRGMILRLSFTKFCELHPGYRSRASNAAAVNINTRY